MKVWLKLKYFNVQGFIYVNSLPLSFFGSLKHSDIENVVDGKCTI